MPYVFCVGQPSCAGNGSDSLPYTWLYGTHPATLVITLSDARTHRQVWCGTLQLDTRSWNDLRPEALQSAVETVLARLPQGPVTTQG
jgi:hypothetical protein